MKIRQRNAANGQRRAVRKPDAFTRPNVEQLEQRLLMAADALVVGMVYIEQDAGSDRHGDTFELTFRGGAEDTRLARIVLDGDQVGDFGNLPGISSGDVLFDTIRDDASLGADDAFPFHIEAMLRGDGSPHDAEGVRVVVEDGGSLLVLEFEDFRAGDRLTFSIDVDEVEQYDPRIDDIDLHNDGLDPLTSGAEFQGVLFTAEFAAAGFYDAEIQSVFLNRYDERVAEDELAAGAELHLPADDAGGLRDRTAAASGWIVQQPLPVSIAGAVFHDVNFDLVRQAEEPPVANVVVSLHRLEGGQYAAVRGAEGAPLQATTDAAGQYAFGLELELPPGTYQVREVQPEAFPLSVGAIPGTVGELAVGRATDPNVLSEIALLTGGQQAVGYDFAEALPVAISGRTYHDRNDNGAPDAGEAGIPGVEIVLTRADGAVWTTLTDETGRYAFESLSPGRYSLTQTQPADWIDGRDRTGAVTGYHGVQRQVGRVDGSDRLVDIALLSGDVGRDYDFGEQLASLAGSVHHDLDGDCLRNPAERGIEGVLLTLTHENGQEWTTRTDADGRYRFEGLPPGVYMLDQEQPEEFFTSGQTAGTAGGDASRPNTIRNIVLDGQRRNAEDYNFCEALGSLSGFVYHDADNDGVRDPGEQPIAGATVELLDAQGRPVPDGRGETVRAWTNDQGAYVFLELSPGEYGLREQQPDGWLDGRESTGRVQGQPAGRVVANDRFGGILLQSAAEVVHGTDFNFGELLPSVVRGRVHLDLDGDCILDPRERALAGVTMQLVDERGDIVATTLTDAEGRYAFQPPGPGEYAVVQQQPREYFHQGQRAGSQGGDASTDNRISGLRMHSGEVLTDYDFCEAPPASLSGYVFVDGPPQPVDRIAADRREVQDGVRSPDDAPLAGVMLRLRDGETGRLLTAADALPGAYPDGALQVVTDAGGYYEFAGLRGDRLYIVEQVQPGDYLDGLDSAGASGGRPLNRETTSPDELNAAERLAMFDDAIVAIPLRPGGESTENNFSELLGTVPPPLPPVPPLPPAQRFTPPPADESTEAAQPRALTALIPPPARTDLYFPAGSVPEFTWHLSIIDAGQLRPDSLARVRVDQRMQQIVPGPQEWTDPRLRGGRWVVLGEDGQLQSISEPSTSSDALSVLAVLGASRAIPVSGDFDGDGITEVGVYLDGDWFLDLNGNGVWDKGDLWAQLGGAGDWPVTGDWDGDGKDDIGIFGRIWVGDARALQHEAGLPDLSNHAAREKSTPPPREAATRGVRLLQRTSDGAPRADLIDHVLHFGDAESRPVVGDWNGDGIPTPGLFRDGGWVLDLDGDGQLDAGDEVFRYGEPGDEPVAGDFDGDGLDEVGVFRDGDWWIDSNRNHRRDAGDRHFRLGGPGDAPVTGDFDGDGVDEPAVYRFAPADQSPADRDNAA